MQALEFSFDTVTETFEFVDTDGDSSRLAMIDGQLQWLEPNPDGGWRMWGGGPCEFNKKTLKLRCGSGGYATLKPEDVDRLMRVAVPRAPMMEVVFSSTRLTYKKSDL